MKAIFAKDVKAGDVIALRANDRRSVLRLEGGLPGRSMVIHDATSSLVIQCQDIVGLVRRPDPKRGEDELLDRIEKCAEEFILKRPFSVQDEERTLAALSQAIEAYELSRLPKPMTMCDGEVGPDYPPDAMPLG